MKGFERFLLVCRWRKNSYHWSWRARHVVSAKRESTSAINYSDSCSWYFSKWV